MCGPLLFYLFQCSLQGCTNVTEVAAGNENLAPYVLVVSDQQEAMQTFLIVDRQVVMEVQLENVPLILMSAFFVFNIHYPVGCSNFYAFLEVYTLGFALAKASPTVKHFAPSLGD